MGKVGHDLHRSDWGFGVTSFQWFVSCGEKVKRVSLGKGGCQYLKKTLFGKCVY